MKTYLFYLFLIFAVAIPLYLKIISFSDANIAMLLILILDKLHDIHEGRK